MPKLNTQLIFRPVTPSRWKDLEILFGPRGACAGCWCMYWRIPRSQYEKQKGGRNKSALKRLVKSGAVPGILAYANRKPIGWCAIEPRESFPVLNNSRILARVDESPVWSVPCFFVAREWRRKGVTSRLLQAAAKFARKRGAKIVEGYPTDTRGQKSADVFVWTGLAPAFKQAGFAEVARRSPTHPIFRKKV
ncbi:MAG: GNAT family N-acetyltransferase [Acidobacteria bacterium]|nr:GNAT family N-acetyltransferase [Acidobacteriota bacterium]